MITGAGAEGFGIADFKDGGRGPGDKEFGPPSEAGNGKETDSLQAPERRAAQLTHLN